MGLSALVYFPILEARIHARSRQVITYMPVLLKQAPFHLAYSNTGFGMKPCKEGWHAGNLKHLGVPVVDLDKISVCHCPDETLYARNQIQKVPKSVG
jgi:hypothetical protein